MATIDELILDGDKNDEFLRQFMSSLIKLTKASNELPQGISFNYATSFKNFKDQQADTATQNGLLIQNLIGFCRNSSDTYTNYLPEDFTEPQCYDIVVDGIDVLLDRADIKLEASTDTLTGNIQASLILDKGDFLMEIDDSIAKPQAVFQINVDNSREQPFQPKLIRKFHAINPSHIERPSIQVQEFERRGDEEDTIAPKYCYIHPYEEEIQSLSLPTLLLQNVSEEQIALSPSIDSKPFTWIETIGDLESMIDELAIEKQEIAIDLEHHSQRTFQGLTCLMQISSKRKDYVIDTLKLRNSMWKLGEIFANSSITKIFHGCDKDILWLQRDFSLYVVNCFDTFHAAKLLKFPVLSLAHLVRYYCDFNLDKKYQLADWRKRPLPKEMLHYARCDTHFLIPIFHALRKEILEREGEAGIEQVFLLSKMTCLQRYEKPTFQIYGYRDLFNITEKHTKLVKSLIERYNKTIPTGSDEDLFGMLNAIQQQMLHVLYKFRDDLARTEDESVQYIMSNAELLRIALRIPRSIQELVADCSPLSAYLRSPDHQAKLIDFINSSIESNFIYQMEMNGGKKEPMSTSKVQFTPGKSYSSTKANNLRALTFTPVILHKDNQLSGENMIAESPEDFVDSKSLFSQAGWRSPSFNGTNKSINQADQSNEAIDAQNEYWSSLIFEAIQPIKVSEEDKKRLMKSMEEMTKFLDWKRGLEQEKRIVEERLKELAGFDKPNAEAAIVTDEKMHRGEEVSLDDIPKSLEEIYNLSNNLRKRKKDKKKQSNEEHEVVKPPPGFDFYACYPNAAMPGKITEAADDVAEVLGVAKSVGWLETSAEANELRDEHAKVILSHQQQCNANDELVADSNALPTLKQSDEPTLQSEHQAKKKSHGSISNNKNKRSANNSVSSSTSLSNSYESIAEMQARSIDSDRNEAGFDYSKIAQSNIGVLSQPTKSSAKSNPQNSRSSTSQSKNNNAYSSLKSNNYNRK